MLGGSGFGIDLICNQCMGEANTGKPVRSFLCGHECLFWILGWGKGRAKLLLERAQEVNTVDGSSQFNRGAVEQGFARMVSISEFG